MRVYIDIEGWHVTRPSTPDLPAVEVPTPFLSGRRLMTLRVPFDIPPGAVILDRVSVLDMHGAPYGAAQFTHDRLVLESAEWAIARDLG